MNQDMQQESLLAGGGGNNTSLGFATGSKCTSSGTFRASNKYIDTVIVLAAGEVFPPFVDGKKTTWFALSPTLSSKDGGGGFRSVKVEPGTI